MLTALSLHWFALTGDIVRNHVISAELDDFPEGARDPDLAGRALLVRTARDAAARVRRARLPRRLGLEGLRRAPAPSAASRCPPGCGRPTAAAQPLFTPSTKADDRPRREHHASSRASSSSASSATARSSRRRSRSTSARPAAALERGVHPRRHEVRVRHRQRRRARRRRRGADARLVALLARRRATRPAPRRRRSTSSSCATGSRRRRGTRRRPAPELPDEVRDGTAARYREAYERLTGRTFGELPATRWGCAREGHRARPAQGRASSTRRARPSARR